MAGNKLGSFLKTVSNWDWEEFVNAERNEQYTSNEAIVFSLIRSCAMRDMTAIKLSLNRVDGKLKTPIKIEYPKVFYLFPNAKLPGDIQQVPFREPDGQPSTILLREGTDIVHKIEPDVEVVEQEYTQQDLIDMGFRETIALMGEQPRQLPEAIIELSQQTERYIRGQGPKPPESPRVKSVVAAHLHIMAQRRSLDAITEVFDQIDGKLVETLQIIGDDLYITNYSLEAPEGAYLNEKGVLQIEATKAQDMWKSKLGDKK